MEVNEWIQWIRGRVIQYISVWCVWCVAIHCLNITDRTTLCCSCGKRDINVLRLEALRQFAASSKRHDKSKLDVETPVSAPVSAFVVYCNCSNQRVTRVTSTIPPATAADLTLTRWRYWSLVFYQHFFQDLQNSMQMNYYRYLQHKQQHRKFVVPRPVRGKPASTTSARRFLCHSCSYSTDRKNNLKRHVTTMHCHLDYAAMTSSGGNRVDGKRGGIMYTSQSLERPDQPRSSYYVWF